MSKHKKQHYIPKCYLKAWCDSRCPSGQEPYIWIFPADSKIGKRKSPENVFHETDMYTLWNEGGKRNLHIEHSLSGIEGVFANIRTKKLNFRRALLDEEHAYLMLFLSAMHVRTKSQLRHMSDQWKRSLELMDEMAERIKTATPEQKKRMANVRSSSSKNPSFTHEQVKKMVSDPVGTMMIPALVAESNLMTKLDMAILNTTEKLGFITSDSPVVWYDPEAYKRPPLYRTPGLAYRSIEITLPVSPTQCIFLNRQKITGHIDVELNVVEGVNRLTRFHADEYYVVNSNESKDYWFISGNQPEDSWEKVQERKETNEGSRSAPAAPDSARPRGL